MFAFLPVKDTSLAVELVATTSLSNRTLEHVEADRALEEFVKRLLLGHFLTDDQLFTEEWKLGAFFKERVDSFLGDLDFRILGIVPLYHT